MIIDAYSHICPKGQIERLTKSSDPVLSRSANRMLMLHDLQPSFLDVEPRMKDLDRYSIDLQVAMLNAGQDPNSSRLADIELLKMTRTVNDECSKLQQSSNGRLYVMGVVPLSNDPKLMVEEMRRAKKELGLKGFVVFSNYYGKPIDAYTDFWREAERLNAIVYIHPSNGGNKTTRPYEYDYDLMHVFGWPYETTIMLSRLIFSGVMKEFPNLKIVSHHMGGMIPFFAARIKENYVRRPRHFVNQDVSRSASGKITERVEDYGSRGEDALNHASLDKPIFDYFRMFNYDTALDGSVASIKCGHDILGADHIVFGTDYSMGPNGGRERLETFPHKVREACVDTGAQRKIFEENILRLLNL